MATSTRIMKNRESAMHFSDLTMSCIQAAVTTSRLQFPSICFPMMAMDC